MFIYFLQAASTGANTPAKRDNMANMTEKFSAYLEQKATYLSSQASVSQPQLKQFGMWANYDKMIAKLDDDDLLDYNIGLMEYTAKFLQEKRQKHK